MPEMALAQHHHILATIIAQKTPNFEMRELSLSGGDIMKWLAVVSPNGQHGISRIRKASMSSVSNNGEWIDDRGSDK